MQTANFKYTINCYFLRTKQAQPVLSWSRHPLPLPLQRWQNTDLAAQAEVLLVLLFPWQQWEQGLLGCWRGLLSCSTLFFVHSNRIDSLPGSPCMTKSLCEPNLSKRHGVTQRGDAFWASKEEWCHQRKRILLQLHELFSSMDVLELLPQIPVPVGAAAPVSVSSELLCVFQ